MWLNEEDELQHSVRGKQLSSPIGNLSPPPSTASEQQKLLRELAEVASALFSDYGAFPDPVLGQTSNPAGPEEKFRRPVDPDELVRAIAEIEKKDQHLSGTAAVGAGLSLFGVMRVLFPATAQPNEEEISEESEEEKQQSERGKVILPEVPRKPTEPPPERFRGRLVAHIERFLQKLAEPKFANHCTATQLVQAAAFPLAVAVKALEGAWINQLIADSWTFRVTDLLFRVVGAMKGDTVAGLLARVRERYTNEGRIGVFDKIVGDGRLWVAVSAALHRAGPRNERGGLEYALAVADVYRERLLWSSADPSRIRALLLRTHVGPNGEAVLIGASKTARVVRNIEENIRANAQYYSDHQIEKSHAVGDPVWREGMGFGWAEEAAPIQEGTHLSIYLRKRGRIIPVGSSYYINMRIAAQQDRSFAELLDQVAPCWPGHAPRRDCRLAS